MIKLFKDKYFKLAFMNIVGKQSLRFVKIIQNYSIIFLDIKFALNAVLQVTVQ